MFRGEASLNACRSLGLDQQRIRLADMHQIFGLTIVTATSTCLGTAAAI